MTDHLIRRSSINRTIKIILRFRRHLLLLFLICVWSSKRNIYSNASLEDSYTYYKSFPFEHHPAPTTAPSSSFSSCDCPEYSYYPPSASDNGGRIAYLISVHNSRTAIDATHLVRAIVSPFSLLLVHIDRKYPWKDYLASPLHKLLSNCLNPCGYQSQIVVFSKYDSQWGEWSMNDPTHGAMEMLLTDDRLKHLPWDVFINLSGDSLPVYTPPVLSHLFNHVDGPLRGINFVTSIVSETGWHPTNVLDFPKGWHKREHYSRDWEDVPVIDYVDDRGEARREKIVAHFGSQWMILTRAFVEYIVKELQREDSLPSRLKNYFIRTKKLMTDETFIPTILVHVKMFNDSLPEFDQDTGQLKHLPDVYAIRYERMDEHMPTANGYFPTEQRYEVPESSKADAPKVWGPYFLGVYDLSNIRHSGALFIRKVSQFLDPNVYKLLPVNRREEIPDIGWVELKISEVPDWEKTKERLKKKAMERMQKEKKEKIVAKEREVVRRDDYEF